MRAYASYTLLSIRKGKFPFPILGERVSQSEGREAWRSTKRRAGKVN